MVPLLLREAHRPSVAAGPSAERSRGRARAGNRPQPRARHGAARERRLRRDDAGPPAGPGSEQPGATHPGGPRDDSARAPRGLRRDALLRDAGAPALGQRRRRAVEAARRGAEAPDRLRALPGLPDRPPPASQHARGAAVVRAEMAALLARLPLRRRGRSVRSQMGGRLSRPQPRRHRGEARGGGLAGTAAPLHQPDPLGLLAARRRVSYPLPHAPRKREGTHPTVRRSRPGIP